MEESELHNLKKKRKESAFFCLKNNQKQEQPQKILLGICMFMIKLKQTNKKQGNDDTNSR